MVSDDRPRFSYDALHDIPPRDLKQIQNEMAVVEQVLPPGHMFDFIAHVGITDDDGRGISAMLGITSQSVFVDGAVDNLVLIALTGWRRQNIRNQVMPVDSISSVETDGRKWAAVIVNHAGGQLLVRAPRDEADRIVHELREAISFAREQANAPPAPLTPAFAPSNVDFVAQLRELGELKAAGVLTEAEFAAAKARILAGGSPPAQSAAPPSNSTVRPPSTPSWAGQDGRCVSCGAIPEEGSIKCWYCGASV